MKYLPLMAFWLLGIVWGSNFIYMKMAAEYLSPLQIVFLRVAFGFAPVFIYAYFLGVLKRSHFKHLPHFVVMSLLATSVYYFSFAKGASLLPSGIAGALSGTIPLFALLFSVLFLAEEKANLMRVLGLLSGLTGVVLIAKPFAGDIGATNLEGVLYMTLGSISVGASFIYAKRYVLPLNIPAAALTTYQLALSLIMLSIITPFQGIEQIAGDLHASLGLIIGLGLLGTGLAYLIYYFIIAKSGAVVASSVTYIPPVVALVIGAFLGEAIGLYEVFATALILVAILLINKKQASESEPSVLKGKHLRKST
ncbi:MAG: DMT family transporter [Marinomonas sp.]|uniref:DMT family transporter n=1 Tax=unclassified Marinomonas TaxID=196814 RepID=UPI0007AEF35E|nr:MULTISPECIES: DMT family transporter [unclassified Marinomonas]KZM39779.1 membrane protein [Marinomonas sp. SBI22]KZM41155.1 membrane protein [Marinomonas sp. SBI8L]